MSGGINFWPASDGEASPAFGSGRLFWYVMRLAESGTALNAWNPARSPILNSPFSLSTGASAAQGIAYDATNGFHLSRENANTVRLTVDYDALTLSAGRFDIPTGVPYIDPCQVLVIREVIKWTQNTTADPITSTVHGFYLGSNTGLNAGYAVRVLNGTAYRGVGIVYRADLNAYFAFRKDVALATYTALPTYAAVASAWHLLEHRLYAPTTTAPGRYELWVNQQRLVTYSGADAGFPQPTGAGQRWRPILTGGENYGGKAGGMKVRASELFQGADSESALAYA